MVIAVIVIRRFVVSPFCSGKIFRKSTVYATALSEIVLFAVP
jgi:hypothetical protein